MDPFLIGLILCCGAAVAIQWGTVTDSINWGFVGLALLAVVAVLVIMTWEV